MIHHFAKNYTKFCTFDKFDDTSFWKKIWVFAHLTNLTRGVCQNVALSFTLKIS